MKRLTYIILFLNIFLLGSVSGQDSVSHKAMPQSAKVSAAEIVPEIADSLEADSLLADSLQLDSIARNLPYPERAVVKIDSLLRHPMFETSQVGVMVWDLDADSLIYAHNERQLLRPASTMKILTAITAIDRLGTDYQFRTSLFYTGQRDSTTLRGNLYLRGGMDPSFGTRDMQCFVDSIRSLGVDTIIGTIVADLSFKDNLMYGEGWCWDDKNPTLTPLLYNKKEYFLSELRSRLRSSGIIIIGVDSVGRVPSGAVMLAEVRNGIVPILNRMVKESDNLYAESVLYNIAASQSKPATAKNAQTMEKQVMRKAGLNPDTYRLADGSGLSLYNYLSAECEVKLLRYAYRNKNIYHVFRESLPIAGVDGTLKKRMKKSPVFGNIRAKTGTLSGISSLAGYAYSPEGHTLAFCIINQGVMKSQGAKNFQDHVCEAISK